MIRVSILAEPLSRMRQIAEMLAEEEQIELVGSGGQDGPPDFADVIVAYGIAAEQMPDGVPTVLIADDADARLPSLYVRAVLPANVLPDELIAAVMAVASELVVLTAAQARSLQRSQSASNPVPDLPFEKLTARESEVLLMVASGLGNKEIASQLGISDHTAKFHVAQILAKLGAASRTEAVTTAIRRGLIPI